MRRVLLAFIFFAATLSARAASEFPPSYRWQTITTDHFFVHFHDGEEAIASRAAAIAEDVHARLVPLMKWEPRERTHIVLADNIDASNGSATFFPYNRIEVFVSAPGADPSSELEYYDNWLDLVITHEYTHILHLDEAFGTSATIRRYLGRNPLTFSNAFSPLWMVEGIAVLMESQTTSTGRLKGTYVDMILRTAAIENDFAREQSASGITPEWPGGGSRYYYGSKFLSWIAQTKGFDELVEFFHEYASAPIPYRIELVAQEVFGTTFRRMYEEWSAEAKREYLAQYAKLQAEGLSPKETLTHLGYETKYPVVSSDGRFVAYVHDGPYEMPTIRVFDTVRRRDVAKRRINNGSHLSWSRDGKSVAWSQLEFVKTFSLLSDLYVWRVGHRAHRITRGARLKDPAFTSDGRALIAVENRAGKNRIVEVDIASGAIRALVTPVDFTQFSEPDVSPDGSRIAIAEWRNGRIDVVLYDRSGKRLRNLTESEPAATYASPRFAPDGKTIFLSSDVTGISNLYSVAVDGGNLRRVSNVYGGAFFPSTSDGRTLFFSDYSSKGFDLARMDSAQSFAITPRHIPASVIGAVPATTTADQPTSSSNPIPAAKPYKASQSLRPTWWLPLISVGGTESVVGAMTSGGDALGFHQYQAQILGTYGGAVDRTDYLFLYSYDRLYPTLTAALEQTDESVAGVSVQTPLGARSYDETLRRSEVLMTLPWRSYWSQLFTTAAFVRDDISPHVGFHIDGGQLATAGIFTGHLQGIRAGALFSNAKEFGWSVSPENGVTASLDYEQLARALGSDATRRELRSDLRGYFTIPYRRSPLGRHVLAARAAAGFSNGDFIFQRDFRVGGADAGGLLALDTQQFPVRGFESDTLRGQNAAAASVEYRFPIYQIERGPAVYPLFFNRLIGDVFADAGTAWNRTALNLPAISRARSSAFERGNTLASAGAEVSLDLFLGYFVPLRYRVGVAWRARAPEGIDTGRLEAYLNVGSSF